MMKFELPVVDAAASLDEALRAMVDANCSGVAIRLGEQIRLLHYYTIREAQERGVQQLQEVRAFDTVSLDAPAAPEQSYIQSLIRQGLDYAAVAGLAGNLLTLFSAYEPKAWVYLSSPPATKCLNSEDPHYYPPNRRDPANPSTCFCGFSIR